MALIRFSCILDDAKVPEHLGSIMNLTRKDILELDDMFANLSKTLETQGNSMDAIVEMEQIRKKMMEIDYVIESSQNVLRDIVNHKIGASGTLNDNTHNSTETEEILEEESE